MSCLLQTTGCSGVEFLQGLGSRVSRAPCQSGCLTNASQLCTVCLPQVRNIVHGSRDALEQLYAQRFTGGPVAEAAGLAPQQPQSWRQAGCEASRAALLLQLPMVGGTTQLRSAGPCTAASSCCEPCPTALRPQKTSPPLAPDRSDTCDLPVCDPAR